MPITVRLLAVLAVALCVACQIRAPRRAFDASGPWPAPILGADLVYQDEPHVLIRAFSGDPGLRRDLAMTLRDRLGLGAVRFNSFGFYSFLGPERSLELRLLTSQTNVFPWFPVDDVAGFVAESGLRIIAGVNPEDGPEAAVAFVDRFRAAGALDRLVAIELGNEPHLSLRPWPPEEYASACADIAVALEPAGVPIAIALTVGDETKTPTGLSDDEYTRRVIETFAGRVPLADRDDVYGVIHLYAGGVDPATIDRLNRLVRPAAPRMRYLVTEYNIRSSLRNNAQLTEGYGLEHLLKTGRLVAHRDVAGLFVHGIPYHSVVYWVGDAGVATVSGQGDPRLTGAARSPGFHLTPAGQVFGLFARELWRGEILTFFERDGVQIWTTRRPDGTVRLGVLNASDAPIDRQLDVGETAVRVTAAPRTAVVFEAAREVGRVVLEGR